MFAISAVILSLSGQMAASYPDARYYRTASACEQAKPTAVALAHRFYGRRVRVIVTCRKH